MPGHLKLFLYICAFIPLVIYPSPADARRAYQSYSDTDSQVKPKPKPMVAPKPANSRKPATPPKPAKPIVRTVQPPGATRKPQKQAPKAQPTKAQPPNTAIDSNLSWEGYQTGFSPIEEIEPPLSIE